MAVKCRVSVTGQFSVFLKLQVLEWHVSTFLRNPRNMQICKSLYCPCSLLCPAPCTFLHLDKRVIFRAVFFQNILYICATDQGRSVSRFCGHTISLTFFSHFYCKVYITRPFGNTVCSPNTGSISAICLCTRYSLYLITH